MVGVKHGTTGAAGTVLTAALWNEAHTVQGVARAYLASDQTITTGTMTKITLDTETFDPDSVFDTTNYRYAPATAGYYLVVANLQYKDLGDGDLYQAQLYKTGVSHSVSNFYTGAALAASAPVVDIILLNATDYIELYTQHVKGANADVLGGSSATWMSVTPLRI